MSNTATKLSVNLNKVALLRNQRDIGYPNVIKHARMVLDAGAQGITIHPRPDERHIRKSDVGELADFLVDYAEETGRNDIEFNIEGYPSDDFIALVTKYDCDQVTLVPDAPNQRTSDHGWDIKTHHDRLNDVILELKDHKRRIALFADPVPEIIEAAAKVGADRVELYTGPYALNEISLQSYAECANIAIETGLEVNAGHDLCLDNLANFITAIPRCAEVSIGHAITADALKMGWNGAIHAYLTAIEFGAKKAQEAA